MEISGHIKIGSTTNGMPSQLSKIHLTKTSKNGNENFESFDNVDKSGYNMLSVKPVFCSKPEKNLKVGEISFVLVNGIYKYRAEVVGSSIVLFPYQPNFENPLVELPIFKLGTAKKWKQNLDMKVRAIAYFNVNGHVFDFKTGSAFSIQEMQRAMSQLSRMDTATVLNANLTLLYKTKLFQTEKTEEVSYLTISEITPSSFVNEYADEKIMKFSEEFIASIEQMEEEKISQMEGETPLSFKAAEEFFGKKITITLDHTENSLFSFGSQTSKSTPDLVEKSEKIEKKKEELKRKREEEEKKIDTSVLESLQNAGLNLALSKALVRIFGDEAYKKAEEVEFFIPTIVKLISTSK